MGTGWPDSGENQLEDQEKGWNVVSTKKEERKVLHPRKYLTGDIYGWYPRFEGETEKEHEERREAEKLRCSEHWRKMISEDPSCGGANCGRTSSPACNETIIREFDTGATRDSEDGKLDYEGFLSPLALRRYAEYMHKHRTQSDGNVRASDNWQKGIPYTAYMKSLWRHLVEFWTEHRFFTILKEDPYSNEYDPNEIALLQEDNREEILCAIIFNAFGYLHELIKENNS